MGKLRWKSMLAGAPAGAPATEAKPHASRKLTDAQQRRAVYRMLTDRPEIIAMASEYDVSGPTLYSWRQALVGKAKTENFESRAKAFIAEFAAEVGEDPKPFAVHRNHGPRPGKKTRPTRAQKTTTQPRRQHHYPSDFRRRAVNRFHNQKEPAAALATELGIVVPLLYAWRSKILGRKTDTNFSANARALAREFIEQAQADDVVTDANEHVVRPRPHDSESPPYVLQPYSPASGSQDVSLMPTLPIDTTAVVSSQPNAIVVAIGELYQQRASLQKDRDLLVQQLEIQKLRRELSRLQTD